MADIGGNRQWLIDEPNEVKKKWIACEIQQRKSQITRLKQDIEDLKNGQIVKLEATIMMLEKELENLSEKLAEYDNAIDITK